ncbi:DUF2971 domain-containing protein [Escherichia coli]|nr:DUF2971 domain-containing protein [Escherichia coli]
MIYHYTDLNAAISIAKSAEVWLTDYHFLNDKEEFLTGYEVLLEAIDGCQDLEDEYPQGFIEEVMSSLTFIRHDNFQCLERNNIFVASFSNVPDLLGQWRNYGKYCIELDSEFFKNKEVDVLECHYLYDDALEYANTLVETHILPGLLEIWHKNKAFLTIELSSLIDIYALSFKHQAFDDESEVRFVLSYPPDDERISFRARGDILIPYIRVSFEPHLLKSIKIGPLNNQDLASDSLCMFAERISRKVQDEMNFHEYQLIVDTSDIPY